MAASETPSRILDERNKPVLAVKSALAVLVPEAEVLVKPFRDKYDPSATDRYPAHVTVLYPFKPPDKLTKTDFDNLSRYFALFKPFHFSLVATRRFPGVLLSRAGAVRTIPPTNTRHLGSLSGNTTLWRQIS